MVVKWPFMNCNFSFFFLTKLKKQKQTKIVIYVIAFDPINIFIDWAHQNDCQILSFMKSINVVDGKMVRNGHNRAIS